MNYSANTYRNSVVLVEQGTPRTALEEAVRDALDIMHRVGGEWTSWWRGDVKLNQWTQEWTAAGHRISDYHRLTVKVEETEVAA